MKPRRDVSPYWFGASMDVNASLSIGKIRKRLISIDPTHRPASRYQARLRHKVAARHLRLGTVRP